MGGGSPLRGNRNSKSTLLDEIDDPNQDFKKVRETGYQDHLRTGWEDVKVKEPKASSWTESMMLEKQMWGKAKGDDTSDFDEMEPWGEDDHSCDGGPDCKFRGKEEEGTKRKAKKSRSPKKKKAKKVAVPSTIPRISSPSNAEQSSQAQSSPHVSSAREDLGGTSVCDEERQFLVRIRPGMSQAEVLFLNNKNGDGREGPFDLEVPLKDLCEFDLLPLPRQSAMIKELPSGKGKEEASSESGEHRLDKYLTGERGVGLAELLDSRRRGGVKPEARVPKQKKPWNDLTPVYEVGELVTFYDIYEGKWKWWKAWVENIILPTELQYRDGMVDILYTICPQAGQGIGNERMIRKEYRLRNSLEMKRYFPEPERHTSLPTHVGPLHSMEMVGIDTCSALSVSTRREEKGKQSTPLCLGELEEAMLK